MSDELQRDRATTYHCPDLRPLSRRLIKSRLIWLAVGIVLIALAYFLFILPVQRVYYEKRILTNTQWRLREIRIALDQYMADHDDRYPPLENWQDLLVEQGYLEASDLKSCLHPDDGNAFALNASLKEISLAEIHYPDRFVVAFEVEPGTVRIGGLDDMVGEHFKGYPFPILFADGHIECIQSIRLPSLMWDQKVDE